MGEWSIWGLTEAGAQGRELKMRSGEPVSTMDKNNDRSSRGAEDLGLTG